VNLFKGRASDGRVYLDEGMQLDSSDARGARTARLLPMCDPMIWKWSAIPRARISTPRVAPQASWPSFRAPLWSAPSQGWNLFPRDHTKCQPCREDGLIEAQIPAQQFKDMGCAKVKPWW
jgi:sulfate transport system ATP-binding protein